MAQLTDVQGNRLIINPLLNTSFVYNIVNVLGIYFQCIFFLFFQNMENKIRNTLNEIYFGKTRDIMNSLRSVVPLPDTQQQEALRNDLAKALRGRQQVQ